MATNDQQPVSHHTEHPYPQRVPDLPKRAIEAALATSTDERAWALIRLAADLRVLGDIETALIALDTAWHLRPATEPARAMFSCAIACHCDSARYDLAHVLAWEQPEEYRDAKFARAACRLYSTLLEDTGEVRWATELDRYRRIVEEDVDGALPNAA